MLKQYSYNLVQALHQLRIRKRRLFDDEDPVDDESLEPCSTTCTLMPKRKKITVKKDPDDTIPLPSLFPLSKYYPCNVELALKSKQMTRKPQASLYPVSLELC